MKITCQKGDITAFEGDALIVNLFEGVTKPDGGTAAVDKALKGGLTDELKHGKTFTGKLGEVLVLPTYGMLAVRYVMVVGLGKQAQLKSKQLRRAAAAAIKAANQRKLKKVATLLHGSGVGKVDATSAARLLTEGTLLGSYGFNHYKSEDPKAKDPVGPTVRQVVIVESDAKKQSNIEAGIQFGTIVGETVNLARDWVNDSANHVTPSFLAKQAESFTNANITCKVYNEAEAKKLGMKAFLSVAQGSNEAPRFIHLTYKPKGKAKKKVALVGKGVTFDSGGLSLKPSTSMDWMKVDMSGAAAVLATMRAISQLGDLDIQVDAIAPCCENMPSGHAYRPGDIIGSLSGKSIEINNTDAEGRVILCDALTYTQNEVKPDEIIDLATLTGACIVALGKEASGIMGTDEALIDALRAAGEAAGERYWPLPLYEEYGEGLKSPVADLVNSGGKGAGSSMGGMFLKAFIEDQQKWAHLDIAGPAYLDADLPETPKGCTATGIRTLIYYLYGLTDI